MRAPTLVSGCGCDSLVSSAFVNLALEPECRSRPSSSWIGRRSAVRGLGMSRVAAVCDLRWPRSLFSLSSLPNHEILITLSI